MMPITKHNPNDPPPKCIDATLTMYSPPLFGFPWCMSNASLSIFHNKGYINKIDCKVKARFTSGTMRVCV